MRVFEIDVSLRPRCGGQLRVVADITEPDLIGQIVDHVDSRAPPHTCRLGAPSHARNSLIC